MSAHQPTPFDADDWFAEGGPELEMTDEQRRRFNGRIRRAFRVRPAGDAVIKLNEFKLRRLGPFVNALTALLLADFERVPSMCS